MTQHNRVIPFCSHQPGKYKLIKTSLNGEEACFSNFYKSDFKVRPTRLIELLGHQVSSLPNGETKYIKFNCVEQGMMYGKAILFGDSEIAKKILKSTRPAEMRKLGRQVKGYDNNVWSNIRFKYVRKLVYEKFRQNKELRQILLKTGNLLIVEAAHYDKIWGVGLHIANPQIYNPDKWQGQNLLGKCLMDTRKLIKSQLSNKNDK